ncbi:MAG: hypothetical protein ABJ246_13955 [Paracoccaceae bacterium]
MNQRPSLSELFTKPANVLRQPGKRKKRPPPVSLRLNDAELAALRKAASGRTINGYIRERLFGDASPIALLNPVSKDREALARVLGALGGTDVFTNLAAISLALEQQRVLASKETEAAILEASEAVIAMRADLLVALGLRKV